MRPHFHSMLIIGWGFIAIMALGFVSFVQFRDLTREHSKFTKDSYTAYTDLLIKNTAASVATYIEQEFPVLHDTNRLKREAGTDWFWKQSGELTRIAKNFGLAYIYYIEKTEHGYIFLMSSGIGKEEHPEWLGGPVWRGPAPAFIDEAWKSGKLTFSPEPTINEWGSLLSAELPILNDGRVVGILGVDYEVSVLMQPLRQRELELTEREEALIHNRLIGFVVFIVIIIMIMSLQMAMNRTMVVIPAQLAEANERTRLMMDSTPMLISIWDASGAMLDCNLEALKILGLAKKSDYIEHFYEMNPQCQPDGTNSREKVAEYITKTFETGWQRLEWVYLTASGEPLPVETTLVRVPWKGGFQLVAYSRDLREIKAKEAESQEAEERMRLMLDTMAFACCFFNENGRVIDCNQQAVLLFGCKDKQEFMSTFYSLSPEYQSNGKQSTQRAHEELCKAFADGKNVFVWEHLRPDGTFLPVEVTLLRVQWKDTYRAVSYMRDLSAQRESEDNLKRVLSITQASPNLMLYIGEGNAVEYMNPAFSAVTGFSDEELLGGGLRLIFNPEDFRCIEREYFPAALQNRTVSFEAEVNDKNGGRRDFAFSAFAAELRDGKTGIGVLGRDITELKQMQRSLMAATEQAEQALAREVQLNKAKSDFLSRISHELRTPLNAIIGMTAVAEKSSGSSEQKHCFEKIKASSEDLLGMVNDILDITDIDTGRLDFVPLPFSFAAAMSSLIDAITPKAKLKSQAFCTDIDENIRDSLLSDKRRLTQVLMQLLSNAVKFTPAGGAISLSARLIEDRGDACLVRFEVGDNGIGISKEAQQSIWGILEQADNSITRKFGGMGIGLPLAKRIVDLMGGEIRVESEPGKGSRFICYIRLGIDRTAPEPQKNDTRKMDTGISAPVDVDLAGWRILLVDDGEINRAILVSMLEDTGAILDEARDGEEAVRMFSQNTYDLVLMDLHMPVVDGFSATKEIRASSQPWAKTVPIISVSAESSVEQHRKCLEAGIDDHLPKPVEMNALLAKIAKLKSLKLQA